MIKRDRYRVKDGITTLGESFLNAIFADLDTRLHGLEELKVSWLAAVTELQNFGLERINGALEPTMMEMNQLLEAITLQYTELATLTEAEVEEFELWKAEQEALLLSSLQGVSADAPLQVDNTDPNEPHIKLTGLAGSIIYFNEDGAAQLLPPGTLGQIMTAGEDTPGWQDNIPAAPVLSVGAGVKVTEHFYGLGYSRYSDTELLMEPGACLTDDGGYALAMAGWRKLCDTAFTPGDIAGMLSPNSTWGANTTYLIYAIGDGTSADWLLVEWGQDIAIELSALAGSWDRHSIRGLTRTNGTAGGVLNIFWFNRTTKRISWGKPTENYIQGPRTTPSGISTAIDIAHYRCGGLAVGIMPGAYGGDGTSENLAFSPDGIHTWGGIQGANPSSATYWGYNNMYNHMSNNYMPDLMDILSDNIYYGDGTYPNSYVGAVTVAVLQLDL